jgi:flavin-dependent dehydrogenase
LKQRGYDVRVVDRARFPRHKVCAGWITPGLAGSLRLDLDEYARGRTLQPITGFRTSVIGGREVETAWPRAVSYGILRAEFDTYLLRRSGAALDEGEGVAPGRLRRDGGEWVIGDDLRAPMLVGAGGHFCPVARWLGARRTEDVVVAAQEIEFPMDAGQRKACRVRPEVPELFFCADLRGYGWCFRKGDVLNVGFGRADAHDFARQARGFAEWLTARGRVPPGLPARWLGHAYLLHDATRPRLVEDGVLLAGDAAGLAYAQSGEGIRPAVESGLLAAETIAAARGDYRRARLEGYRDRLRRRFGAGGRGPLPLPAAWVAAVGRTLLARDWFTRRVALESWFLHARTPVLAGPPQTPLA